MELIVSYTGKHHRDVSMHTKYYTRGTMRILLAHARSANDSTSTASSLPAWVDENAVLIAQVPETISVLGVQLVLRFSARSQQLLTVSDPAIMELE